MPPTPARALIAEDEPLLAAALQQSLAQVWPELQVLAVVGDGLSAVQAALHHRPQVLFFDIRMPGQSGLQAACELLDAWPADGPPFPALVFISAYDQYAVQAFEAQAVDYLLKPVQIERLQKTVQKIKKTLISQAQAATIFEATAQQLHQLLAHMDSARSAPAAAPVSAPLALIQAAVGSSIHLVPVADVLYFEAADKYVRVLTAQQEYLIRTPLKELAEQLDAQQFWQVHRGTLVRASAIARVLREEGARLRLQLHGRDELVTVSRLYAHRFKAM